MQQSYGSPVPPTMIPTPVGTRLSRSSTTSSGRYYSRSSFGSSSSNTSGRSRSISVTYKRADKTVANRTLFAKRASTSPGHSLLRKAVRRSTTATTDDAGYDSDFEEQHVFDAVDALKMRFNKSPKTPSTLRALRIMEQRTGTSNIASTDMTDNTTGQTEVKHKERKVSVEDWSDDYDIPETAECFVRSESPKHIPAFPLDYALVSKNVDTSAEEAMNETTKYEPLVAPVDALPNITDTFFRQGGFTRTSSAENISDNHAQDNSLDIEEIMAGHSNFANATQLLNKTDNLDFSTTSFQVWRDVPSSLSMESFSNSPTLAPTVKNDNNPLVRVPLQQKVLVRRTPSKLRNENKITSPDEGVEVDVPEIVLYDATEGNVDPDVLPSQIFETYPSGVSTLPIWVDSASFFTALEAPSEADLIKLGEYCVVEETQDQFGDGTLSSRSLAIDSPPTPTSPNLVPISDSDLKSCIDSLELGGSSPVIHCDGSPEHATFSTSASVPVSLFASSLPHHQIEATRMASPNVYTDSVSFSFGADGVPGSPAQAIAAFMFSARLPTPQQGLTGEDLDVGAIMRLEAAARRFLVDGQRHPAAPAALAPLFQISAPVVKGVGLGMSIPPYSLVGCDFPSIESLVSLPDFYEFSNSVPINVLERPSPIQSLFSNENEMASVKHLDFEDALLCSLPAPITKLSAEEARDWRRTVKVCVITPSPTIVVDAQHDVAPVVTATYAPSVMNGISPLDGKIFADDDATELRDTCDQEEEDYILPAPLSANNVSTSAGLFSKDPLLESGDLMYKLTDLDVYTASTPLIDHATNLPESMSVELGISGINNTALEFAAAVGYIPRPLHSSSPMISSPLIDDKPLCMQELLCETVSVFPSVVIQDVIVNSVLNVEGPAPYPKVRGEWRLSHSGASQIYGHTKRQASAIERWRQACAKAEVLSLRGSVEYAAGSPSSVTSMLASSAHLPNLHRSMSSPSCTTQYSSLSPIMQAGEASASRTQSLIFGHSARRDVLTYRTNGCAHKRRSKKMRSSPKPSFLSKASSIPPAFRSNTAVGPTEETGAEPMVFPTPSFVGPGSFFVEGFKHSEIIPDSVLECLPGNAGQKSANESDLPSTMTPPQSPLICRSPNLATSEDWGNADIFFRASPRPEKRGKFWHLFKRPGSPAGYVAVSTTTFGGPGIARESDNSSMSPRKFRRSWFNANHHQWPLSSPSPCPITPSPATPALSRSPKRKGLNFNWIARSGTSALVASSPKASTGGSSDSMTMPRTKSKGGCLGAVVHKLQSLL